MYFLFSGEGPSDLGSGWSGSHIHEHLAGHFKPGPLAHLIDQMIQQAEGFSPLDSLHCGFVSENTLGERKSELNPIKKAAKLPGVKREKESIYFYNHARVLARIARKKSVDLDQEPVVAILFRDADGTASASRGNWANKHGSILRGFADECWPGGVPMVPNPKSEAWFLCALQDNPYQNCHSLELASGNDRSPNALKPRLEQWLGPPVSAERLGELVKDRTIDAAKIDMPSFQAFRDRLHEAVDHRVDSPQ